MCYSVHTLINEVKTMTARKDIRRVIIPPKYTKRFESEKLKVEKLTKISMTDQQYAAHLVMWALDQKPLPNKAIFDDLADALNKLLKRDYRNTCQHDETERQGFIWEVCRTCGEKWSDDRCPKPEWSDPEEWGVAENALANYKALDKKTDDKGE